MRKVQMESSKTGKTSVHFFNRRLLNREKYGCKPQKQEKHLYISLSRGCQTEKSTDVNVKNGENICTCLQTKVIKLSKVQMENSKMRIPSVLTYIFTWRAGELSCSITSGL
jgi:hypothetical protein